MMEREKKPGLTSSRIAKELKKQKLLDPSLDKGEAIKAVIKGIRKLGKSVIRSKNGHGMYVFSFSRSGFKSEIKGLARWMDDLEEHAIKGEADFWEKLDEMRLFERQEDHIWL